MKQPVTKLLVAISALAFLYVHYYLAPDAALDFLNRYALNPSEFRAGAFWQPVSGLLLHTGWFHFLINVGAIWSVGQLVENTIGSSRYAWLCFFSGVTGSVFVILFQSDLPGAVVGASGILAGLLGLLALFYPNSTFVLFVIPIKARTAAIVLGILSILLPHLGSNEWISYLTYFGGFMGGVLYSRFALELHFGSNELRETDSYLQRKIMQQDVLRAVYDRMNRVPDEHWRSAYPEEKVINPVSNEERPDMSPKKLHYDTTTGKFYLR